MCKKKDKEKRRKLFTYKRQISETSQVTQTKSLGEKRKVRLSALRVVVFGSFFPPSILLRLEPSPSRQDSNRSRGRRPHPPHTTAQPPGDRSRPRSGPVDEGMVPSKSPSKSPSSSSSFSTDGTEAFQKVERRCFSSFHLSAFNISAFLKRVPSNKVSTLPFYRFFLN